MYRMNPQYAEDEKQQRAAFSQKMQDMRQQDMTSPNSNYSRSAQQRQQQQSGDSGNGQVAGAAVNAGADLALGLMMNKAANERAKQDALFRAEQKGYQTQIQGLQDAGDNARNAFAQIMKNYRAALIR